MPWKEPGKGDKDPWNSGGDQPPDLDEVFRNLNRKVSRIFGGNGGNRQNRKSGSGSGGVLGIVIVALVLWVVYDSVHIVDEVRRVQPHTAAGHQLHTAAAG